MAFQFGQISAKLKPSDVKKTKLINDYVLLNMIKENEPYYIFLFTQKPAAHEMKSIQKAIAQMQINSFIMLSAMNCVFDEEKIKSGIANFVNANKSKWEKYLNYNGQHCSGIMTFGSALYAVTKSTDIMVGHFYADQFTNPYVYIGNGFCGDYDTWVVPVDEPSELYPVLNNMNSNINWRTRFFFKQLKVLKNPHKWVPDLTPFNKHIVTSQEESDALFKEHMNSEAVSYDTETTGLDTMRDKVVCLTITWDGINGYYIPWDLVNKRLMAISIDSCKHRITQNGKFDCKIMWTNGLPLYSCEPTDDTGQLAHAIHSERVHGLKPLTFFYTYFGGYDLKLDSWKKETGIDRYDKIPKDILSEYAIIDAIATFRTFYAMQQQLDDIDKRFPNDKLPEWTLRRWYEEILMPVYPDFIEMEYRGFYVDRDEQFKGQQVLIQQIKDLEAKICESWGINPSFPLGSTVELGKLFEKMGWECIERTKTGVYATSDACLVEWKRLGRPCMDELSKWRSLNVFLNTFMAHDLEEEKGWNNFMVQDKDGQYKIHCSYIVNGTKSYRNIGKDPNLQQIPVHAKEAKYVMKMISVPPIEEFTIETDDGRTFVGIANEKVLTPQGPVCFKDIKEDTEILDYYQEPETVSA